MRDSWPPMRKDKLIPPPLGSKITVYAEYQARQVGQRILLDIVQLEPEEFDLDPWEGGAQPGWEEQEDSDE